MNTNAHKVLLVMAVALFSIFLRAQDGTITGLVLDPAGNPASGAKVIAMPSGSIDGIVPSATTDKTGQFVIRSLPWGMYFVTAGKEQDNYPPQDKTFYAGNVLSSPTVSTVILDSQHSRADVTVRLSRRAGVLVGIVTDAVSGRPVYPCAELRRTAEPQARMRMSFSEELRMSVSEPTFRVLLPADTDVSLVVWDWGYEPWRYSDISGNKPLRIAEGQEVKLSIRMKPTRDHSQPPTDDELKAMRDSIAENGCNAPLPD